MTSSTETPDWTALPRPEDDGAARHLVGTPIPAVTLRATDGRHIDLSHLSGLTVLYAYPRTGVPDKPNPDGWDAIPGARGCSPQSCAFRDHFQDLRRLVSPPYSGFPPRTPPASAKPPNASTCRSRFSPMKICSSPAP